MPNQQFDTADFLRLEIEEDPTGYVNLIPNPDGKLGGWGWVTSDPGASVSGEPSAPHFLTFDKGTAFGTVEYATEPMPVTVGDWLACRFDLLTSSAGIFSMQLWYDFYDSGLALLSSNSAGPNVSALGEYFTTTPRQVPASTAFAVLRIIPGVNTTTITEVMVTQADTEAEVDAAATTGPEAFPYAEPATYLDVLGPTHEIKVVREALNLGTLNATILDSALDPSQDDLIRPGRRCRLMALVDSGSDTWEPLFTGKVSGAKVTYELKDPDVPESQRARIALSAVDHVAPLANQNRSEGVATIAELPYVLEGCGVPWNCNGSGDQVPTATIAAKNDNASALDQVAVTRDTVLGFAWVDRYGVLQAWDAAEIDATVSPTALDEDAYSDLDVDFDTDRCINEVTVKALRLVEASGETQELIYGPYRDEASIAIWDVKAAEFTVYGLADEAAASTFADAVLAANATPAVRVNSVTVPVMTEAHIADYAAIDLYSLTNVVNLDSAIDEDYRVVGLELVIVPEKWLTTYSFETSSSVAQPTYTPSPTPGGGGMTLGQLLRPVGEVTMYAGTTAPAGWLKCDGSAVSRTEYADLFAAVGTAFGAGNGSTTFNIPDMRNRLPVGVGSNYSRGSDEGSAEADRSLAHQHVIGGVTEATNTSTGGSGTRLTGINANTGNTGLPRAALNFIIRAV